MEVWMNHLSKTFSVNKEFVSDNQVKDCECKPPACFVAPDARVLVVDDVYMNLVLAKRFMAPFLLQVDLCSSGEEALDILQSKEYDLVFMDQMMPGMDGTETTAQVRAMGKSDPYFRDLPVVALTADTVVGVRKVFLDNGFSDYVLKPIDIKKFNAILKKWIPEEKQVSQAGSSVGEKKLGGLVVDGEAETCDVGGIKADRAGAKTGIGSYRVNGLDVKSGIAKSGGVDEFYIETLHSFCEDGFDRIPKINECLKARDFKTFTTYVHAMKSAAANISATGLSEMAARLEDSGRRGDVSYLEANTDEFIAALDTMVRDIRNVLSVHSSNEGYVEKPADTTKLKDTLIALKAALDNTDLFVINKSIDNLKKLRKNKETATHVSRIADYVLMGDYEEAAELSASMLREC